MYPVHQAIAEQRKSLQWTESQQTAFANTKKALADATMLQHPYADAPLALSVDALDVAVGAVLEQCWSSTLMVNGTHWHYSARN